MIQPVRRPREEASHGNVKSGQPLWPEVEIVRVEEVLAVFSGGQQKEI